LLRERLHSKISQLFPDVSGTNTDQPLTEFPPWVNSNREEPISLEEAFLISALPSTLGITLEELFQKITATASKVSDIARKHNVGESFNPVFLCRLGMALQDARERAIKRHVVNNSVKDTLTAWEGLGADKNASVLKVVTAMLDGGFRDAETGRLKTYEVSNTQQAKFESHKEI
jgi:hypothetical protein